MRTARHALALNLRVQDECQAAMGPERLRVCRIALLCVLIECSVECSTLALIHHGLQPPWAGGQDNGAADGCEGLANTLLRASGGAANISRPQLQSKDLAAPTPAEIVCSMSRPVANNDHSIRYTSIFSHYPVFASCLVCR